MTENEERYHQSEEKKITTNSAVYGKLMRKELGCDRCPPNRGENAFGSRRPKADRYKDVRKGRCSGTLNPRARDASGSPLPEHSAWRHDRPAQWIEILGESNSGERRRLIQKYGESRFLRDSGAKMIDSSEFGDLYVFSDRGRRAMIRVTNSTPEADGSYKHYLIEVPPSCVSARQAVAWTFGMTEREYQPDTQS